MSCPQTATLTCKYGTVTETVITALFVLSRVQKPVKATEIVSNGLQQDVVDPLRLISGLSV